MTKHTHTRLVCVLRYQGLHCAPAFCYLGDTFTTHYLVPGSLDKPSPERTLLPRTHPLTHFNRSISYRSSILLFLIPTISPYFSPSSTQLPQLYPTFDFAACSSTCQSILLQRQAQVGVSTLSPGHVLPRLQGVWRLSIYQTMRMRSLSSNQSRATTNRPVTLSKPIPRGNVANPVPITCGR